jgi:hypothetical protein
MLYIQIVPRVQSHVIHRPAPRLPHNHSPLRMEWQQGFEIRLKSGATRVLDLAIRVLATSQ